MNSRRNIAAVMDPAGRPPVCPGTQSCTPQIACEDWVQLCEDWQEAYRPVRYGTRGRHGRAPDLH